jgi:hypothetical protein
MLALLCRRGDQVIRFTAGIDRWRRTMPVSNDSGRTWSILWIDELHRMEDS